MTEQDHNTAVRTISKALKGPVADVFRNLIPALRDIGGNDFYDAVLTSPDMLHGCLLVFRKRRDAFAALLVDGLGRPVNDDFVALRCGRSVHDIVAMIVRTHAKRHFQFALGGDPNDSRSMAGALYAAVNEYLIHDWQVPLVAHYAPMPVEGMWQLGPGLLDLKTAAEVDAAVRAAGGTPIINGKPVLSLEHNPAPHHAVPLPSPMAAEPILVDTSSREADFWWETLNDPMVRSALGPLSDSDKRELTSAFCTLSDTTRTELLGAFALSLFQGAVLLTKCHQGLGRASFVQIFGKPGRPDAIKMLADQLRGKRVNSRTDLNTLARTVEPLLATLTRNGAHGRATTRPTARRA